MMFPRLAEGALCWQSFDPLAANLGSAFYLWFSQSLEGERCSQRNLVKATAEEAQALVGGILLAAV